MNVAIQQLVSAAQKLPLDDQLDLIAALSQSLKQHYPKENYIRSISDLNRFAGDFWPADETADDINDFIYQQRANDRLADLNTSLDAE